MVGVFTLRNIGGVALFLAGTTWLWLTPAFAPQGVRSSSVLWNVTGILCFVTIVVFSAATWGLFARHGWWEPTAVAAAALGLVALVPYWVAAIDGGETAGTVAFNAVIHVLMAGGVLVLLLVPTWEHWVSRHVMSA